MFELADDLLTAAGMRHYEISNFARPGCESLHNWATWLGEDYDGLGPGAFGTRAGTRYHNADDTRAYIAALAEGHLPPEAIGALADGSEDEVGMRLGKE